MLRGKTTRLTLTPEDIAWHTERQIARRQLSVLAKARARHVAELERLELNDETTTTEFSPRKAATGRETHGIIQNTNIFDQGDGLEEFETPRPEPHRSFEEHSSSPIPSPPLHSFSRSRTTSSIYPYPQPTRSLSPIAAAQSPHDATELAPPTVYSGNISPRSPTKKSTRDLSVYNDELPAVSQPQTPVGLPRNGLAMPTYGRSPFLPAQEVSGRRDGVRGGDGARGQARMRVVRLRRGREFVRFELR